MVGKPNFPENADERTDLVGMSMPTPGLTPLDQEREASMADEGGMSGAVMESEDGCCARDPTTNRPYPTLASAQGFFHRHAGACGAMLLGGAALVLAAYVRTRRA